MKQFFKIFVIIKNQDIMNIEKEIIEFRNSVNKKICCVSRLLLEESLPDIYDKYCKIEEQFLLQFKKRPEIIPIALNKSQIEQLKQLNDSDDNDLINKEIFDLKSFKQYYTPSSEYWKAQCITIKEQISINKNYSITAIKEAEKFSKKLYSFIKEYKNRNK